jgi:hypothetical protein
MFARQKHASSVNVRLDSFSIVCVALPSFLSQPEHALGNTVLPSVIGRPLLQADNTDFAVPYRLSKWHRFGDAAPHFTFFQVANSIQGLHKHRNTMK